MITKQQYNQVLMLTLCMTLFAILNMLLGNQILGTIFCVIAVGLTYLLWKAHQHNKQQEAQLGR